MIYLRTQDKAHPAYAITQYIKLRATVALAYSNPAPDKGWGKITSTEDVGARERREKRRWGSKDGIGYLALALAHLGSPHTNHGARAVEILSRALEQTRPLKSLTHAEW